VIEWDDFQECIKKISNIHGWKETDDQVKNATGTLKVVWTGLQKLADENIDQKVTKEEWYKMWDVCYSKDKPVLPDWQLNYCNFFFDITDTSGDNLIDAEEYAVIYKTFGFSEKACADAFKAISDGGKNPINRAEYEKLWKEYILSDNKAEKGNNLFGVLSL